MTLLKIFYCFLKISFNKLQRDTVSRPAELFNKLNYLALSFSAGGEPVLLEQDEKTWFCHSS